MARIGKQPIIIPTGVTITHTGGTVVVTGPKGGLEWELHPEIKITIETQTASVSTDSHTRLARQIHGTTRNIIANMIKGVDEGWSKTLEISGTGYRAAVVGKDLVLNLGFSHPVNIQAPQGISFEVKENKIIVSGADKSLVGQMAANIRETRPADPYKAKGIKYLGEKIRRKAGKAAKTAGAAAGK